MQHTFFQAQGKTSELVILQCRIKVNGLHGQEWDYIMLTMMKPTHIVTHHNHCPHSHKRNVTASSKIDHTNLESLGQMLLTPSHIFSMFSPVHFQTILVTVPVTRTPFLPWDISGWQITAAAQPHTSWHGEPFKNERYQYSLEKVPKHKTFKML